MDFHKEDGDIIWSSRSQMFPKIGALKKLIFNHKKKQYPQENACVGISL